VMPTGPRLDTNSSSKTHSTNWNPMLEDNHASVCDEFRTTDKIQDARFASVHVAGPGTASARKFSLQKARPQTGPSFSMADRPYHRPPATSEGQVEGAKDRSTGVARQQRAQDTLRLALNS